VDSSLAAGAAWRAPIGAENLLSMPVVGDHRVRIISPTVLELSLITSEQPGGRPDRWDYVDGSGTAHLPAANRFAVRIAGQREAVTAVGFKRRVLYAPLKIRDLRIANELYLRLGHPIAAGAVVTISNPDGAIWAGTDVYEAKADPMRLSPAIHVSQAGYIPGQPKKAMVGYYLGSLGELEPTDLHGFNLIDVETGKVVYTGNLKPRPDQGWTYNPPPYQQVLEADFSAFQTPGLYRIRVEGLGVSLSFRIDEGIAAQFARTFALGLYHQRCGTENALPFTRFLHAPCHTAAAEVPTAENKSVEHQLSGESSNYKSNPLHTAPQLKDIASSLYPFIRQGTIDVSGGHHDAGDYSKYTINSAQLIHTLVFAADSLPGAGDLDNLGIPESGDGKSDLLQIAKWEADFLAKMQDDDGGFYFLVYPKNRAYEDNVTPDHGDPRWCFPRPLR